MVDTVKIIVWNEPFAAFRRLDRGRANYSIQEFTLVARDPTLAGDRECRITGLHR